MLARATGVETKADYILVSEPHIASVSNTKWHVDKRKDSAIGIVGKLNEITSVGRGDGKYGPRSKIVGFIVATFLQMYQSMVSTIMLVN